MEDQCLMEKPTTLVQEVEYILFQQTELETINIDSRSKIGKTKFAFS